MNEISPDQLLSQIRSMSQQLQMPNNNPAPPPGESSPFGELLKGTLQSVSDSQMAASDLRIRQQTGEVSIAEAQIAGQKAKLSFQAVTEVRNKLITAYQDIMNMPV